MLQKHLYCELQPSWATGEDVELDIWPWISNTALRMLKLPFREKPYLYYEVLLEILHSFGPSYRVFPSKDSFTLRELIEARKHDTHWATIASCETGSVRPIHRALVAVVMVTKLMNIWAPCNEFWVYEYLRAFQSRDGFLD